MPHYLIGAVKSTQNFSVASFKEKAETVIGDILSRAKLPVIVGGTGFYIEAVVDGVVPAEVPPNPKLRKELNEKSIDELANTLRKLDPERAKDIQEGNKRRLIRAIEIAESMGSVPKRKANPKYNPLQIGLLPEKEGLKKKIEERVEERIESGWIEEVESLLKAGTNEEKLSEFGLGYKIISDYLTHTSQLEHPNILNLPADKAGNVGMSVSDKDKKGLVGKIATAEWRYAKRQMTWFKRDERISWFSPKEKREIFAEIEKFLV